MKTEEQKQPNYITKKDVEIAKKLGKFISENVEWKASSKELMEIFQYLMWYNSLPTKLADNIIEVEKFVPAEELQQAKKPSKKSK